MCDADNVLLEAVLIAHVGGGFGDVIAAEESKQVAVLLGNVESYLSEIILNK